MNFITSPIHLAFVRGAGSVGVVLAGKHGFGLLRLQPGVAGRRHEGCGGIVIKISPVRGYFMSEIVHVTGRCQGGRVAVQGVMLVIMPPCSGRRQSPRFNAASRRSLQV